MLMRLIFLVLLFSSSVMAEGQVRNYLSYLYGYGTYYDHAKDDLNVLPDGQVFKSYFGARLKFFESQFIFRYAKMDKQIAYLNEGGEYNHKTYSAGMDFGIWFFSFLKARGGYAFHRVNENIRGITDANYISQFKLRNITLQGPFGGGELVFFPVLRSEFFLDYNYYHFNRASAHEQEIMVGFRFFLDKETTATKGGNGLFNSIWKGLIGGAVK